MSDLAITENGVITLKEITDLISVQHSKAMGKIKTLSKQESFGEVSYIDTLNLNNVKVKTMLLTKKQAIAAGAKLNDALLMKVIDRVEEIESSKALMSPNQITEALSQTAQSLTIHREALEQQDERMDAQHERINAQHNLIVSQDDRLRDLELTRRIESWQKKGLKDAHDKKVYQLSKEYKEDQHDKKLIASLHRKIWSLHNKRFILTSYSDLQALKYNEAIEFLNGIKLKDI